MRVVVDYRPALRSPTGVGEYVHQLVRHLAARRREGAAPDLELTLFSSSWKDRLQPAVPDVGDARLVDARVPVRVLNLLWHRARWPSIERLAGPGVDVVHSCTPLAVPASRAAQVVTLHDLDFLRNPHRVRGEIRRDYPALARRDARRADRVIAVSHYTAREAARALGVPPERLAVCPPGVPGWAKPRARPPGAGEPRSVLFVGTLEPRKNVGRLLAAYARLVARRPDAPDLVLAGKATAAAASWLDAIRRPPLAGRVRHLGYVPASALYDLYAGAALVVLPSLDEGFGLPALEAMAVGVPVVAANRGALPEVLGEAGLLVDPEDEQALAAGMERILDDPGAASRAVAAGLARARLFDWRETAARVEAVYRDAVLHRRARGQRLTDDHDDRAAARPG